MLSYHGLKKTEQETEPPISGGEFGECFSFTHGETGAHSISQAYTAPSTPYQYIIISFFANFTNFFGITPAFTSYNDIMIIPFAAGTYAAFGMGIYHISTSSGMAGSIITHNQYFGPHLISGGTWSGANTLTYANGSQILYAGCTYQQNKDVHVYGIIENTPDGTKQRFWLNGVEYGTYGLTSTGNALTITPPADANDKIYLSYSTTNAPVTTKSVKMSSICIHGLSADTGTHPFNIFDSKSILNTFVTPEGKPKIVPFDANIFVNQQSGNPRVNEVGGTALTFTNCDYAPLDSTTIMNIKTIGGYLRGAVLYWKTSRQLVVPMYAFIFSESNSFSQVGTTDFFYFKSNDPVIETWDNTSSYRTPYYSDISGSATVQAVSVYPDTVNSDWRSTLYCRNGTVLALRKGQINGSGLGYTNYMNTTYSQGMCFIAIYAATDVAIPWSNLIEMENYFLNEDKSLKDGGVDGSGYIDGHLPLLLMDARYGYAQCVVTERLTDGSLVDKAAGTIIGNSGGTLSEYRILHKDFLAPIKIGDDLA